jgi:hypothetical protein
MKTLGVLGTLTGVCLLVAARAHYTLDIAVGAFVSSSFWLAYYIYTRNIHIPDYRLNPIFLLFEDQLPREDILSIKEKGEEKLDEKNHDDITALLVGIPPYQQQQQQQQQAGISTSADGYQKSS